MKTGHSSGLAETTRLTHLRPWRSAQTPGRVDGFLPASAQLSAQRQIAEPCHLLTVVAGDLVDDLHFLPLSGAEAAGLFLFPAIINSLIFLLHCGVVFCFSQSRSWYKICYTRPAEPCGVVSC